MTQKEKLIKLINEFGLSGYEINDLADYLIENGVVVLKDTSKSPCLYCDIGWGSVSTDGIKSCSDNCHKFKEYIKQIVGER